MIIIVLGRIAGKTLLDRKRNGNIRASSLVNGNELVLNKNNEWNKQIDRLDHQKIVTMVRNKSPAGQAAGVPGTLEDNGVTTFPSTEAKQEIRRRHTNLPKSKKEEEKLVNMAIKQYSGNSEGDGVATFLSIEVKQRRHKETRNLPKSKMEEEKTIYIRQ